MPLSPLVVLAGPDADPVRLAAPIVTAFANDPFVRWMLPQPDWYLAHFSELARGHAEASAANGGARHTGDFAAAALWFPPGVEPPPESGEVFVQGIREDRRETAFAIFARMRASHPAEPAWHLRLLGVDPPRPGSGYGSALLAATLRELDELHLGAFLESTSAGSVRLYERHGFVVTEEIQAGDSPPLWPMLRTAR